jgi:hypothetical protein
VVRLGAAELMQAGRYTPSRHELQLQTTSHPFDTTAPLWMVEFVKEIPTGLIKIIISFCQLSTGYFVVNI